MKRYRDKASEVLGKLPASKRWELPNILHVFAHDGYRVKVGSKVSYKYGKPRWYLIRTSPVQGDYILFRGSRLYLSQLDGVHRKEVQ